MGMKQSRPGSVEVVNVVGSGDIDTEIDLGILHSDLGENNLVISEYDQDNLPAVKIRFEEDGPLSMVYRSGKYVITGARSLEILSTIDGQLLELMKGLGIIPKAYSSQMGVRNIVCVGDLNRSLDLQYLTVSLGLENTEYEPEQSPFLIYRVDDPKCVMTIANSGRTMITGIRDRETAEKAFNHLKEKVRETDTDQ